MIIYDIVI